MSLAVLFLACRSFRQRLQPERVRGPAGVHGRGLRRAGRRFHRGLLESRRPGPAERAPSGWPATSCFASAQVHPGSDVLHGDEGQGATRPAWSATSSPSATGSSSAWGPTPCPVSAPIGRAGASRRRWSIRCRPAYFTPSLESYRWRSFIGSITLAPSIAVRVNDWMLLGTTFNLSYGFFQTSQWAETAVLPTKPPTLVNLGQQGLDINGWGFGATFGLLDQAGRRLSVGLTWRTQANMSLSGTMGIENIDRLGLPVSSDTSLDVPNPTWLAGGIAVKPLDRLTVTFDLQWTNWAKLGTIELVFGDPEWAGALADEAALVLDWKDRPRSAAASNTRPGDIRAQGRLH
ncbi:MAG: outer membrane protein transport protein [Desulfobacterales bacterium]|nr:outer membrane protein transport protein [Desulfobacterales bacterium]